MDPIVSSSSSGISLPQSLNGIEYMQCAQCLSILALKVFVLGAATTDGGSAFHSLITRTLNAFRRTRETALGFCSFHW